VALYINGTVRHGECWLSTAKALVPRKDFCGAVAGQSCAAYGRSAATGAVVTVTLDGATVIGSGKIGDDGEFNVTIGSQVASSTSHTITVAVGGVKGNNGFASPATSISLAGVLFGEVYLCAGQSNMAISVAQVNNATAEIAAAHWPLIRVVQVASVTSLGPVLNDTRFTIPWSAVTPTTVPTFSGLCYYFGT
jgi:sialate O-acetylesterase